MSSINSLQNQESPLLRRLDPAQIASKPSENSSEKSAGVGADIFSKTEIPADNVLMKGFNQIEKMEESGTLFASQQKAQEEDYDEGTVLREFMDFMKKTPAERWYEQFLKEEGLTKEELEALPPEEREKVEKRIQEKMEQVMKQGLGIEDGESATEIAGEAIPAA